MILDLKQLLIKTLYTVLISCNTEQSNFCVRAKNIEEGEEI